MIRKIILVSFLIIYGLNHSIAQADSDADWCSIPEIEVPDGTEVDYLKYLEFTPIAHIPFTEGTIEQMLAQENSEYMYVSTASGKKYIHIIDAELVKFPQPIKLTTFITELDETKNHYLETLGVIGLPKAEDFPYDTEEIETLVYQQQLKGSDAVFIKTHIEKVMVDGVEQDTEVRYIYIIDELYEDPTPELLSEFVSKLNIIEKKLNEYGLSIREGGDFKDGDEVDENGKAKGVDLYAIFNDPDKLEDQILETLRLEVSSRVNQCIQQIVPAECPILDSRDVYNIPGVSANTKVSISDHTSVTVEELILAANTSALAACAIGYGVFTNLSFPDGDSDFFPEFDSSSNQTWARFKVSLGSLTIERLMSTVFSKFDIAIGELGLGDDSFLSPLLFNFKRDFGNFDDIKLKFEEFKNDVANFFSDLIGLDDDGSGDFPDFPNIFEYKAVQIAPAPPLEITKEYNWVGLDVGSDSTVSAKIDAHAEMRAGEQEMTSAAHTTHAFAHYARATAQANVTVFNNTASLASAAASAYAGIDRVSAQMDAQILGYNWNDEKLGVDVNKPLVSLVKEYSFVESQSETFHESIIFVGPIPVRLHAGAFVRSGLVVEYGLVSLKVYSQAKPFVAAGLTASATLDIIIVAAGVQASLTLIDSGIPITAQAALLHTEDKEPYIDMDLNGDAYFRVLDGYVAAYARYYVPRASIPPWKKKTVNKILFSWTGMGAEQSIFSWGATLGSQGLKLRGNPLTMGIDELDEGSTLNDKVIAIIGYQNDTNNKIADSLGAVVSQIDSAQNLKEMTAQGIIERQLLDTELTRYNTELIQIFNEEDPLQKDTDNDGIPDVEEEAQGTDPQSSDSDGDGIPDSYELAKTYLDPNNPNDAALDQDGDGFSNVDEVNVSSDPNNPNITPDNIQAILMIPIISLILQ